MNASDITSLRLNRLMRRFVRIESAGDDEK